MSSPKRPSIRQVAEHAGVAMSTVSRVISSHPDVSPEMRARVLQAVEELGYRPDFLAQSLRRGATLSIGFVLKDIANPVTAELVRGAEEVLRRAGYSLLVMNSENDADLDAEHIRFLRSRRIDGLLLLSVSERKRATTDELVALGAPVVALDRELPRRVRASAVLSNHRQGMEAAVSHLLSLGHRRIGLVHWPLDLRAGRERVGGLHDAYEHAELPDTSLTVIGLTVEEGERAIEELLDQPNPPTALIAGSNQLLIGCLRALKRRGLHPGRDIALVTCDDVPLAELYDPPLAVIARDNAGTGRIAAELLLQRINVQLGPTIVMQETRFIPRESCSPPIDRSRLNGS